MSAPKPPFHSVVEELLYNILTKMPEITALTENDINTIAKLNALILDGDVASATDLLNAINSLKGNVPEAGNTLEKLYNIIQGLSYLTAEDIDTLAELNAILADADLVKTEDLLNTWSLAGNNVGAEKAIGTKDNFSLPFITNNIERGRINTSGNFIIGVLPDPIGSYGLQSYKAQIIAASNLALGVWGSSYFINGDFNINLGLEGSPTVKNIFRVNSYVSGLGGYDFALSADNMNAAIEITDSQFGGTKNEMMRLTPGGYANTGILIRPNDSYNMSYGFRYLLQGTNVNQEGRFIRAFHAQLNYPVNDVNPNANRAQLFVAQATVTNHHIDGFFADVRGNQESEIYAYRSLGSRLLFDGNGMGYNKPVLTITTDASADAAATALLLNGSYVISAALYLNPKGSERTGLILSPGHKEANGLFIGPQQGGGTYDYDGYLLWLQYSTTGNNIIGNTSKPMFFIRKHNAVLNGFDHSGAFIRMEENIGSSGPFIEAYKYDNGSNSLKLKFSVDKDGVVSIGQLGADAANIAAVGRLYMLGQELRIVLPNGDIKIVNLLNP